MSERRQLNTLLARLRAWEQINGPISDSAMRTTKEGVSVINALSQLRREGTLAGPGSPLEAGTQLAGLNIQRRQDAHTLAKTISDLMARAMSGEPCSPKELKRDGAWGRQYDAIRKRYDWEKEVVIPVLRKLPGIKPRVFFDRLPDLRWHLTQMTDSLEWLDLPADETLGREALVARFVASLAAFAKLAGVGKKFIARSTFEKHLAGKELYAYINNRSTRLKMPDLYKTVVGQFTGEKVPIISRSGSKSWKVTTHSFASCLDGRRVLHPHLQSPFEVFVDDTLALAIGMRTWTERHAHAVLLRAFVGTCNGRLSSDIVLLSGTGTPLAALEVGAGDLAENSAKYRASREEKKRIVKGGGLLYLECDLIGGRAVSYAVLEQLVHKVAGLLDVPLAMTPREAILKAAFIVPGEGVTLSLGELKDFVREHRIRTQRKYNEVRLALRLKLDPIAPSLPAITKVRLDRWEANWFEITGRTPSGPGSRGARAGSAQHAFYGTYEHARRVARRGGFRGNIDYKRRRHQVDPRLPGDPDQRWPNAFERDGWSGYLGTGASNADVSGLVPQGRAWALLGLTHGRWKHIIAHGSIRPAARREKASGDALFFSVDQVVALAVTLNKVRAGSDAERQLRDRLAASTPA